MSAWNLPPGVSTNDEHVNPSDGDPRLEVAYLTLLAHPHDAWRIGEGQAVLCALRDVIADLKGWTAEKTQKHFEAIARIESAPTRQIES